MRKCHECGTETSDNWHVISTSWDGRSTWICHECYEARQKKNKVETAQAKADFAGLYDYY